MSEIGLNPLERGIILSGVAIVSFVFQILIGLISDKFQTIKYIILLLLIIFIMNSYFVFNTRFISFFEQFVFVSIAAGLVNTLCGAYDTWLLGINETTRENLSNIKAAGSVGWAIGSIISSIIIIRFNWIGLKILSLLLIIIVIYQVIASEDLERIVSLKISSSFPITRLIHNYIYILLILTLLLNYSLVIANSGVVIDKMISLNATDIQISLKWSMGSLLEIPTYLIGSKLLKKFNSVRLLQISIIASTLQFLLYGIANDANHMIVISSLQLLTTPVIMIASKKIIMEITPREIWNSSQLIGLSIFTGIPSIIVPIIAGFFVVNMGLNITMYTLSILGIVSLLMSIRLNNQIITSS